MQLGEATGGTMATMRDSASMSEYKQRYLIESIVTDIHWTCLAVGCLAVVLGRKPSSVELLRPWRSTLSDDSAVMQLCLRYGRDVGISSETVQNIDAFYSGTLRLKQQLLAFLSDGASAHELHGACELSYSLARSASKILIGLHAVDELSLDKSYSDNSKVISAFLADATSGGGRLCNEFGEIRLPKLSQRRANPRRVVQKICNVQTGSGVVSARIQNVSRGGFGLLCEHNYTVGQPLTIQMSDGRRLEGTVAWLKGDRVGVQFNKPLAPGDNLIIGE